MIEFNIPDISCAHCVGVVEKAVKAVDATATVEIDIPTKKVRITSTAEKSTLANALVAVGYAPTGMW
jgi:copper chaperone CopZ